MRTKREVQKWNHRVVTSGLELALTQLLHDRDQRDALITKGRTQVARYSWDECAEGVVRLYQSLC